MHCSIAYHFAYSTDMATYLKIFLLTFLLSSMILLEEVKTVMAKRGKLKQRVKILEKSVSELKEEMKDQKEKMEELEKCSGKYTHHLFSVLT